jgi:hypothetical protein
MISPQQANGMRTQIRSLLLLSIVAGCTHRDPSTSPSVRTDDFGVLNAAKIELVEEGGIAAILIDRVVRHDDRFFLYTRRQICNQGCAAPSDSVTGTLSPAATDSLFTVVWSQSPFTLKDDYGTSKGAADMIAYTLRMTFDGTTKTIRADDGTMPPPMRQIVDVIRGTISAAR